MACAVHQPMLYYLSKILPLFVLPHGVVLALLIAGIVFRRRWMLITCAALFWISSTPLVSAALLRSLEGGYVRVAERDAAVADAIVVLSEGRSVAPGPAAISQWSGGDRFFPGIELYKADRAPLLMFTGG